MFLWALYYLSSFVSYIHTYFLSFISPLPSFLLSSAQKFTLSSLDISFFFHFTFLLFPLVHFFLGNYTIYIQNIYIYIPTSFNLWRPLPPASVARPREVSGTDQIPLHIYIYIYISCTHAAIRVPSKRQNQILSPTQRIAIRHSI